MASSLQFDPCRPFGVVCHDAGGANQVIAMLQRRSWSPTVACMAGPASLLWQQAFPDQCFVSDLPHLAGLDTLITGTGWASTLEHDARHCAREAGIKLVSVLDHWTNYASRFSRRGTVVLPDELWVVDEYAETLAQETFPDIPVIRQPDYYAEREIAAVAPMSPRFHNELLYVLEPMRSDWGRSEPGEVQALRFFLMLMPELGIPPGTVVRLRPHPSEVADKYAAFLNEDSVYPVRMATGTLVSDLSHSCWVAGCQSYAMTLALRAGRTVFGTLPPWAPRCALPHHGIVHLRDMVVK